MIDVLAKNKELKDKFKDVSFQEEGHKYTIKGQEDREIKSVSSLLHYFVDEFDKDGVAEPYSKARGLSKEDVIRAWEGEGLISTTHGSKVHLYAEHYICDKYLGTNHNPVVFDKQSLGAQQFVNDLKDKPVKCVASELVMYHPKYWYTGTADIIMYNETTGNLIIGDFKSNVEIIYKGPFKKAPLNIIPKELELVQDNYGKYSLQFSFYQILLEDMGYKVDTRVLIHLTDDKYKKKLYKTYRTPDLTKYLREWLETKEHLK